MEAKKITYIAILSILIILNFNLVSAVIIDSVDVEKLYPGESASLRIDVKNIFRDDVEQVSLVLNLDGTGFTTVGSSEDSQEKIRDGDEESFNFKLKASNDLAPGDYNIPYIITYTYDDENGEKEYTKNGSFGVSVEARTELDFSIETDNNIVGMRGRISLEIINRGLGELKSVQVKVVNQKGYELISSQNVFLGNIDPEDSELVNFEVIFKTKDAEFFAEIKYKDFSNQDQTETINLPINVYSIEEAKELGLVQGNNLTYYIFAITSIILLFFIWRGFRKKKRKNKNN